MSLPISLPDLADYAAEMAADLDNPLIERELWESIANEVTNYMTSEIDDAPMFNLNQGDQP